MALEPIKTPCIGICKVDEWVGLCYGCGRRIEEISAWSFMEDSERLKIMLELRDRLNRVYGDDLK